MARHGKAYRAASEEVGPGKSYGPKEAVSLLKKVASAKFDETVELHMRMALDPRHADQQLRGVALLPHGLGKKVRVLVFAEGDAARAAKEAGADFVGAEDLVKKIEGNWVEFDVAVATPDMMSKIGKLGRILGRRGLMPNPKTGTVVQGQDIARAVEDAQKGRVEFRLDRTAIVHLPVGKVSFEEEKLLENIATIIDAIKRAKPSGVKGQYVHSITVTSTMGPGIRLDLAPALAMSVN